MSQNGEQIGSWIAENDLKYHLYKDRFVNWLLSECKDETQLLQPLELQNSLTLIENKILNSEENLFLIASILKILKKQLQINLEYQPQSNAPHTDGSQTEAQNCEEMLTIVALNFVEKAQREQLKKIPNAHAIAIKILIWTEGKPSIANKIFQTILHSETFLMSNYLENLTLWLTSEEQDLSQLLTGESLKLALKQSHYNFTEVENQFLVRSLVFNLRG